MWFHRQNWQAGAHMSCTSFSLFDVRSLHCLRSSSFLFFSHRAEQGLCEAEEEHCASLHAHPHLFASQSRTGHLDNVHVAQRTSWHDALRKGLQSVMKHAASSSLQCRERWNHHLKPGINKDAWTAGEEQLLVQVCLGGMFLESLIYVFISRLSNAA